MRSRSRCRTSLLKMKDVDGSLKIDPVVRLMLPVGLLQMSLMAMSTSCLEVRVDLDVEEEGVMKPGMMLSKSVTMK